MTELSEEHRMAERIFSIDIGGSGIKGAVVDLDRGIFLAERFRAPTLQPAAPEAVGQAAMRWLQQSAARGEPQRQPAITRRLMERIGPPKDPLAELTPREQEVLRLIARGLSNKEIGLALTLTEQTVKGYVRDIQSKLSVADRTQAALLAVRHGLVRPDDLPRGAA